MADTTLNHEAATRFQALEEHIKAIGNSFVDFLEHNGHEVTDEQRAVLTGDVPEPVDPKDKEIADMKAQLAALQAGQQMPIVVPSHDAPALEAPEDEEAPV